MFEDPQSQSTWTVGTEGVPPHVVCSGVGLPACSTEGVDRFADDHIDKPDVDQHLLPACTRQATGNSTSPQVNLAGRLLGNGESVGDVGELKDPSGAKHPEDLLEDSALVGTQVEDPVGDHNVGPAPIDRERLSSVGTSKYRAVIVPSALSQE